MLTRSNVARSSPVGERDLPVLVNGDPVVAVSVRIEAEAWDDPRFGRMARLSGWADSDHAVIKVAKVWAWQTLESANRGELVVHVPDWVAEEKLGLGSVEALLKSGLSRREGELLYMCGTRKAGRIDWLLKNRLKGMKGGRPRKEADESKPEVSPSQTTAKADTKSSEPSVSVSVSGSYSSDSLSVGITPEEGVAYAVAALNRERTQRAPNHLPIKAPSPFYLPPGSPEFDLREILAELHIGERQVRIDHAVAVLSAQADAGKGWEHLRLGNLAGPRMWRQLQETTTESARRTRGASVRDGPRRVTGAAAGLEATRRLEEEERNQEPR